jgi:lysophospholipase L1-like esterase
MLRSTRTIRATNSGAPGKVLYSPDIACRFIRLSLAIACLLLCSAPLAGQATSDHSADAKTIPWKIEALEPGSCSFGEVYLNAVSGQLRQCTATNVWSNLGGGTGGLTPATFASPPSPPALNASYLFSDAKATGNCTGGGVLTYAVCVWNGSAWTPAAAPAAAASPSVSNLVAEYTLAEGGGGYAYNYTYPPTPIYNLVGPSEQEFTTGTHMWLPAGMTATDEYANDPNGDFVASRLQATSTGGYLAAAHGVTFTAGQQYTLSIYVASNTGAAQTIRMTDNNVSYGPAIAVPATGWIRASYTFTASGTGTYVIPVAQDATHDALDLLIWGAQLEIGPHPSTYVPQVYQMVNGGGPQNTGGQCAWIAAGVDCTANAGTSHMDAAGWQPIDLTTATIYAAVKWTGTPVLAGYAPILSDNYNNPHLYLAGIDNGTPFPHFRFAGLFAFAYGINLNDGKWHIVAGEFDGANISLYLDGAQAAFYNVGTSNAIQVTQLFLSNFANAAFWPGQIGYAALYSVAHSAATITANTAAIRSIMAARGVTIPALSQLLVFEGDSITDPTTGVNAQSKYYYVAQSAITPFPQGANDAVSGSGMATVVSREATVDGWFAQVSGLKVLFLLLGANDKGDGVSTFEGNLKAYCLARKAATPGLKIVLATLLPQTTSGFNAFRDAVNALIYADPSFYDALADFAASSTMGCDACAANTTNFPDGEHPSIAGHAILAPIAQAAIQAVGIL